VVRRFGCGSGRHFRLQQHCDNEGLVCRVRIEHRYIGVFHFLAPRQFFHSFERLNIEIVGFLSFDSTVVGTERGDSVELYFA
jgi:hypothetical protein